MYHIVKRGDTLSEIAKKHGTTVEALVASNGIVNPNVIRVGQLIEIPEKDKTVDAVKACLSAIEQLPEYQTLEKMLNE